MNARRIASKSAIDLVGLNEAEIFDANASLGGELGGSGLSLNTGRMEHTVSKPLDHAFSFQVTSLPSRSIIVSNLSALLNDESIQMLFQVGHSFSHFWKKCMTLADVWGRPNCSNGVPFARHCTSDILRHPMRHGSEGAVEWYGSGRPVLECAICDNPWLCRLFHRGLSHHSSPPHQENVPLCVQGTLLVFHIDPKLDAQQVTALFSKYGEVKRAIRIPDKENHRLIEFYDLRHANAAMDALNSGESTQLSAKVPGFSPTRLKQTMSLQQIAGETVESEKVYQADRHHEIRHAECTCSFQDEDQESRSWDGSAQAVQQMETLMGLSDGHKQTNFIPLSNTGSSSALEDH